MAKTKVKTVKRKNTIKRNWRLYLMTLPAIIYMLIFCYKPMYGILIAFKDFKMRQGILGSEWIGFENFARLFSSYWFPIILKNTLTLSVLTLVVSFPLPIILALILNEVRNDKFRKTFQTISYAPHFISVVVICSMVTLFLSPSAGVINHILDALGFERVAFMESPEAFKWIYVLSGVWQGVGWSSIIYFAALAGVDKALIEAAEIDGANRFQRIWHINVPVLMPTVITLLILQVGSLLSVGHEKAFLLQNALNLTESEIISTYVYKVGLVKADFSFGTAASLFNSVVNTVFLCVTNWISKKVTDIGLF